MELIAALAIFSACCSLNWYLYQKQEHQRKLEHYRRILRSTIPLPNRKQRRKK